MSDTTESLSPSLAALCSSVSGIAGHHGGKALCLYLIPRIRTHPARSLVEAPGGSQREAKEEPRQSIIDPSFCALFGDEKRVTQPGRKLLWLWL